ncbi:MULTISPECIES: acetolactate synthase large subunit [unclassified Streptomyces]|uniref:acetolactate synthase large subunit n=1 Tax=unclassified Streptomyces TaxID=2593676 RepID=UPI003D8CD481
MNGARALIRTLVDSGVDVCFANPGTSEMHFIAAVDDIPEMRMVLGLFEGVVTGAADGFARMTDRPAATLLHLGPGMANGMANLHNARKAGSPMVNIVGDHATYHKKYDSPLNSDIESVARTFSGWLDCPARPEDLGPAAAEAVAAAMGPAPAISTLILPADVSWGDGASPAAPLPRRARNVVDSDTIEAIAKLLHSGERCLLLMGGAATRADALRSASRVSAATGAALLTETSLARLERGGGLPAVERLKYRAGSAIKQLAGIRHLILVDAKPPVSFFAYPGKKSDLVPEGCEVHVLTSASDDSALALAELADLVGPGVEPVSSPVQSSRRSQLPSGALTPASLAATVAALLPEGAVVIDEGVTAGGYVLGATESGPRHDWLNVVGGAIGIGLPLAVGCGVAVPDRKVVGLQADGSTMYTIQGLWTIARENLDVTTIILNNRQYGILRGELARVGANEGPKAFDMLDLSRPDLDFVSLAHGMGVEAERATTAEEFTAALERALTTKGPRLVEVIL